MRPIYQIAIDWAYRCFGTRHVDSTNIRALRLVEEAVEYAQSCGVTVIDVGQVVKVAYSRPRGEAHQEMGGVLMTAVVACAARGWDPEEIFAMELRRVLGKPTEEFAKRNREKIGGDV